MKISIRSFRRVERADIAGGPLVLVGGKNNNGKSSILNGIALAAVGWGIPQGLAKNDADKLILWGHESAMVSLAVGAGMVRVSYPKVELSYDGDLRVSTVAAGLTSIPSMPAKEVSAVLGPFIGAEPTLKDIIQEVADLQLPTELAGKLWSAIEAKGWDGAAQQAQVNGVKLKGFWEQTTGQKKWGAVVGASWKPEGWDDALLGEDISDEMLIEKRRAVQAARENAAVDGAELARLRQAASSAVSDAEAVVAADAAVGASEAALQAATEERAKLKSPDDGGGDMPCPHCGGMLRLERVDSGVQKLVAPDLSTVMSDKEIKAARTAIARADGDIANARVAVGSARQKVIEARVAARASADAAKALEIAEAKEGSADVGALVAELAELEEKALLIHRFKEATRYHGLIVQNIAIQALLAADGLRHKVLVRSLDKFNAEHLAPICAAAGWDAVSIDPDMVFRFGHQRWPLLIEGGSARWIVERVIQIAIAKLDGSALVIIDGADVCDADNRNRLFKVLLAQTGFETLVGMTFNKPDLMPKLGKAGACYWVTDGVSEMVTA